jgi:hypothetical protein
VNAEPAKPAEKIHFAFSRSTLMGEKDHSDQQLTGAGELVYATLDAVAAARGATADPSGRRFSPTSAA